MLDLHLFSSLYSIPFQAMQTTLNIAFETLALYVVAYVVTDFACWASRPVVTTQKVEEVAAIAVEVEVKVSPVVIDEVSTSSTVEEVEVTSTVEVVTVSGKLTVAQLKSIAKKRGLKGYTKFKKAELLTLLT